MNNSSSKELVGRAVQEIPGLLLTASRYYLAVKMSRNIQEHKSNKRWLALFVGADILDGKILRAFAADTPLRRAADGIVDHISVAKVATATAQECPRTVPYLLPLAVRAATVGGLNLSHLIMTGEVTKGQLYQRAANLSLVAFQLAAESESPHLIDFAGALAVAISVATVVPHTRDLGVAHIDGIREL